ncbi:hypothetical protein QCA50_020715 [Cerrena zonata]|uniref:Uncharacterized protein n=1 Tax=Cerrena zonata TaxID=2478898 RepID=A0AAW0FGG1_9APHY
MVFEIGRTYWLKVEFEGRPKGSPVFVTAKETSKGQRHALRSSNQPVVYKAEEHRQVRDLVVATARVFHAKVHVEGIDSNIEWIPAGSVGLLLEDINDAKYTWNGARYAPVKIKRGTQVTVGDRWSASGTSLQPRPLVKSKTDYDISCNMYHTHTLPVAFRGMIPEQNLSETPVV